MPTRSYVLRPRAIPMAPLAVGTAATIVGAIACVLAAALLYWCFAVLALLDDTNDVGLGCASSPRVIAVGTSATPRV